MAVGLVSSMNAVSCFTPSCSNGPFSLTQVHDRGVRCAPVRAVALHSLLSDTGMVASPNRLVTPSGLGSLAWCLGSVRLSPRPGDVPGVSSV
ncbi:hypothetical protein RRG08_036612 [Elysia crispata]|uniref:Uncharacterized protein n=1 Tax=Elysia crispata TaxID=231223 RepID=A0AAE0ZST3_9GAST|nr:hypothetical protein RRG08_036612 [Elysia crispata]